MRSIYNNFQIKVKNMDAKNMSLDELIKRDKSMKRGGRGGRGPARGGRGGLARGGNRGGNQARGGFRSFRGGRMQQRGGSRNQMVS